MMSITSVAYIVFVGISLLIYYAVPHRFKWWVLLADSLMFFFVNSVWYTFVYLAISVVTVWSAVRYFARENARHKKAVLVLTLIVNIGMLAVLKYTNLVINTVNFFKTRNGGVSFDTVRFAASLAISFYTLQIIGYLLDCYWEIDKKEDNIFKLLLFTSYFPLMISGPISRHSELQSELFKDHEFDYNNLASGARRIAWGILKKVVVADRIAVFADCMFADPDTYSGIWVMIAAVTYIIELYFDFSGCMDIIIGVSKCFDIRLTENFKAPFLSKTIQEFWQRWHISLGAWLKTYVMYPILKTRLFSEMAVKLKKKFGKGAKKIPSYIAMFAVWFCMGLWHGNSWKYILGEGLWFWLVVMLGQIFEPVFEKIKKKLHIKDENPAFKAFRTIRTILIFAFGVIFFNSKDLFAGFYMVGAMFRSNGLIAPLKVLYNDAFAAFGGFDALCAVFVIVILQFIADIRIYHEKPVQTLVTERPLVIRWVLYFAIVLLIVLEGAFGQSRFIYFGF